MPVTHTFVSAKADGGDATLVRPSNWNAAHVTAFTEFTQDLGVARSAGTFDITGLSGLTAGKPVQLFQTAAAIITKGNARDEPEMDQIAVTGYVVDATTVRCYWMAPSVVVGTYAFAYTVGG